MPERDVLSITISPLYRVRHTPGPEAQEVFVMLAEHEAASMLATKDNDGRSLATLISEALVPFRAQIGETIFRAMEPPVSLAAGYTPAADVIRLCMTPVHRQLVLAHLYDDDEMGATEIAGALHMDAGTTYRYLEPLVRWGVLEENSKFQLMAAGQ
ncbi:MAG TPA: helix-turn-helix domain-containing protein [Solirubrobacteraceae bacterium]|nr:helix-turn-helix domain-containing protein [Solirubrobacteraceae bacterium]